MASTNVQATPMDVDQPSNGTNLEATGLIYPPPDIRKKVDKVAELLWNKGAQLENKIRENERHNPLFSFLNPTDPFHAYYQYKLRQAKEAAENGTPFSSTDASTPQAYDAPPESSTPSQPIAPPEPPMFEFSTPMPAMSAKDLDIIKLTARFAARNGRQFISQLAQRESRNYQFDFLRPNHSLFPYFTELIKQYSKLLVPSATIQADLTSKQSKTIMLDRIRQRMEWTVWSEQEKKKKQEEDEKERLAYATIEWHDFVVVETIEFTTEDEKSTLPAPMSLAELENMSLAQKHMAALSDSVGELPDFAAYEKQLNDELGEPSMAQQQQEESAVQVQPPPPSGAAPIKIRTDYKPKIQSRAQAAEETVLCPRCHQSVLASEMAEHMRIELLDPQWKEQKNAALAKNRGTNLVQDDAAVANVLKNLSAHRADSYGNDDSANQQNDPSQPFMNQLPMLPETRRATEDLDEHTKRQRVEHHT
ncbi:hypothetical protein DM01DRAFT_1335352 [Hesseltinella vesiculosa]|uniref:SURP motif domain-containing protein n=1 Tax=Hesseltinella vesiculosa TaxID=101127 RepID=A0A1X2GJ78_9FUNG|nr:hypothetical protein DM01DRAFT_1335352 [Hesseltinella vesiculosa]